MLDSRSPKTAPWLVLFAAAVVTGFPVTVRREARAAAQQPPASSPIALELRRFRVFATVLHVGAHPDDENTQLIAYLAGGRAYRAAYLSVTRGDGGQNLLGPELGEKLGVARTQELLAARRIDGGQQFFTRALDYGFSKDVREALSTWDYQQVLSDVVRVIRTFRPDVIVTRFSAQAGGTHGHHTASAVLAVEAFKLAGDPKAFPEQLRDLTVWQPKRILMNSGATGRGGNAAALRMDVGGNDAISGESFASIARRSRAQHKTQGFGNAGGGFGGGTAGGDPIGGGRAGRGGPPGATVPAMEGFTLLDGEPATTDIMDGIDTTWNRVSGGAEIARMADAALASFDGANPAASVPELLALRVKVAAVPTDPVVADKRKLLDHIIAECVGLAVGTEIPQAEVVPSESMRLKHTAVVRSSVPVRWIGWRYPSLSLRTTQGTPVLLRRNEPLSITDTRTLPANTPLTQPYWLREDGTPGMFRVDDATLIGGPENPPSFPIDEVFEIDGQLLAIPDEPVQITNAGGREVVRRLDVISPAPMHFTTDVALFAPGSTHPVSVELVASRADVAGSVQVNAPPNWTVTPATQSFRIAAVGGKMTVSFTVRAPAQKGSATLTASATIGTARYSTQRVEINYDHIPFQLLQPKARMKAVALEVVARGKNIGYVPGAGDDIVAALQQLGYAVTTVTAKDATPERLRGLDAIVMGIRAFNVRTDLDTLMPALFAYAEQGGTVIEQYSQSGNLKSRNFAPYPLQVNTAGDRVTDENAPVTFLAPDHPALNKPNKITSADFDGWVQERGTYFPNQWDEHFKPILSMKDVSDPKPFEGSLLIAQYGKGYFVYTGLTFFRQLPAGVPGAYRLFANLISLGQSGIVP
jgi:LmbE family N-acetylglucosaminyl deacetylase